MNSLKKKELGHEDQKEKAIIKDETADDENERDRIDRRPSVLFNDPMVREMFWYMEHSRLIRFGLLESFTRYMMNNIKDIENELKKSNITPPGHFD